MDFTNNCQEIYNFYKLAVAALQHPEILKKEVEEKLDFLTNFAESPLGKKVFIGGKNAARTIFTTNMLEQVTKKSIQTSIDFLGRQTVVLFHSYIEIVMADVVELILEKDEKILKHVYFEKKGEFPFSTAELIDNKDKIMAFMSKKEVSRFVYKNMKDKMVYLNKFFNIDYTKFPKGEIEYETDILKIDTLRHDIIHTNKSIVVESHEILAINMYIGWFGMHLLTQARSKFQVDIVWQFPDGINRLK
jgi:hypothetical protein